MTTPLLRPDVAAEIRVVDEAPFTRRISGGFLTLDALRVPYATASIELPVEGQTPAEVVDPRDDTRVVVTASDQRAGGSRTFDLGLRSRVVDHVTKTIRGELASDEALALDYATLTTDTGARAHETSLRRVVEYVLGKIPGVLRNLEPNPRGLSSGSVAPYQTRFSWARSFVSVPGLESIGLTTAVRFTSTESGTVSSGRGVDSYGNPDLATPGTSGTWLESPTVTPGETITFSRYLRANVAIPATGAQLIVRFHNGAGAWIGGNVVGAATGAFASATWVRPSVTTTVPAGATRVVASLRIAGLTVSTSTFLDVTGLLADRGAAVRAWTESVLASSPATDADVTAYWAVTSLVTNPSVEVNTTGWGAGTGTSAIARITGAVPATPSGTASLRWTAAGTGAAFVSQSGSAIAVVPGVSYVYSGYVLGTSPVRDVQPMVRFVSAAGEILRDVYGTAVTTSTAAWTRFVQVVKPPAGAVSATLHARSTVNTAGQFHFLDCVMFHEGTEAVPYFDGSTPDSSTYIYDWAGDTAHAAASTRDPVVDRPPELFTWLPGVNAWTFLEPLLSSVGLRLFCDELRVWRLIDPISYTVPGAIAITPNNATDGTDEITREDPELFATGVVVRYTWRVSSGAPMQVNYDVAGTPQRVYVVDYERPYPGPGAAAKILARRNGTGRAQDVTGLVVWAATPGMSASISLPETAEQRGAITVVEFSLDDDALMRVGTRGLVQIPPGSIDALDGTIDGLVGTIDALNPTTHGSS